MVMEQTWGVLDKVHRLGYFVRLLLVVSRMADWMKQRALTRREEEILRQLMLGFSNKLIAKKLALATGTVKTRMRLALGHLREALAESPARGTR